MGKVIKASGNEVEPYWPGLFSKALEGQDIAALLKNVGSAPAGGAGPAAATGGAEKAKVEGKNRLYSLFPYLHCHTIFDASIFYNREGRRRARRRCRDGRPLRRWRRLLNNIEQVGFLPVDPLL